MLQNYFKIAVRTLFKHKGYSLINIFSLSIGIACCALIFLYVRDEWTHDRFHENADRIYRTYRTEHRANGTLKVSSSSPAPLAGALRTEVPGIEQIVRLTSSQTLVRRGDEVTTENLMFADDGFFDLFTFPMQSGSGRLTPDAVILSTEQARLYFGDANPIGRTLDFEFGNDFTTLTVTGVAEPIPSNSSITFDFMLSYENWPGLGQAADNWGSNNSVTYLLLSPETTPAAVRAQLPAFTERHFGDMIREAQAAGWFEQIDRAFYLDLQPLTDVYLNTGIQSFFEASGNPMNSYLLAGIALVVLLLGCFNFMTLAVGRATSRAREVGLRKVFGAQRSQLMHQFWGEALILSIAASITGVILAGLLLPAFNTLSGKALSFDLFNATALPALIALILICGLVAGSFPALVLSAFQPVQVLKGKLRVGRGIGFSKSLVVFQFAVSVLLIAATLVIYRQVEFVKQYNLGFADEEVVVVSLNGAGADNETRVERFRSLLATSPDIVEVSGTSNAFGEDWSRTVIQDEDNQVIVYTTRVEPNYLATLDIPLLEGRNFDPNLVTDVEESILVNETFAREMGWTDPVGEELPGYEGVRVIGVVADYHFRSLHNTIEPALLHMSPQIGSYNVIMVRLRSQRIQETLRTMQDAWQEIALNEPFTYEFLDQRLDQQYQAEEQWGRIVTYASFFALLIACLGLFGLTTLSVTRRTKEIGIRKVLGASVAGIVLLLSRNFLLLVGIALLPAVPLTYYVMNNWLSNFAYHIEISWGIFLVTGLTALGIALLTVSYQAVRAALSDPVNTLRYE